ncbi:ROK family transcriptional regulator [Microlunatus speluncae]|uniref:ROK family transcriptional regulator n=1 Tax=Microlunatus speluncae TaxID=2594267 RepID=UPI0012665C5B|nr:ROK family transcriptional regulator [Microlunatus speluncae]
MGTRSASDIRSESRFAVLRQLLSSGTATRQDLAVATTLSTATVANVVAELLDAGLVHVVGKGASVGRPSSKLAISDEPLRLVGVDIAETYATAAIYSLSLEHLAEHSEPLDDTDNQPRTVIAGVVAAVHGALARAGVHPDAVAGIGISVPGQVMPSTGVSVFAPNWDWHQVNLRDQLEPELGLSVGVHLDNPLKAVTVAALWLDNGPSTDTMVVVNLGTGVGAGIAINGRLVRGTCNNAGEWGHTTLVQDGRPCRCGRRGCVEAYVGVPGMQATLAELAPDHPAVALHQDAFIAAVAAGLEADDPTMMALLDRTCASLAYGLGDVVNLLNPDRILLCGWMFSALQTWIMPRLTELVPAQALEASLDVVSIQPLEVGRNPVTAGMAIFALEDVLARHGLPSRLV